MVNCYNAQGCEAALPIVLIPVADYPTWLEMQSPHVKNWLISIQFRAEPANSALIPNVQGSIEFVLACIQNPSDCWSVGNLPMQLPPGQYKFAEIDDRLKNAQNDATSCTSALRTLIWGLGAYQFTRYKLPKKEFATLCVSPQCDAIMLTSIVESIHWVRDLINTPADDMGPSELAQAAKTLVEEFKADYHQILGEDLLQQNYSGIYTVGRASNDPPRLIDIRWGHTHYPKLTLIGKGVCFDSGGLDIKPSYAMLLMKKDMAGAAHVLGLARMIMAANLPICLRVLIPAVENVIAGNAYRPGDVIKSRSGITIEVGNTDAEGRIILADAITEAVSEEPALLIDISTLTGAARVALGTELPALFCNKQEIADKVVRMGNEQQDPMWQLPLFLPYRDYLNSTIADINNNSAEVYGGAITAALFLQEFVPESVSWLHFDIMAWNLRSRPGKPVGAEAMCLRALFQFIKQEIASLY